MQMKTEGRRGEASFSIHEVSWPFACHAMSCVCVCVSVWGKALQAMHLRLTHTYCTQSTPNCSTLGRKKNITMPVSVWGVQCVSLNTHTHMSILWCSCRGLSRLEGVSSTVCNPPPTMYDPFVFCDRRGKREGVYLTNCALLLISTPTHWIHKQLTFILTFRNDFLAIHVHSPLML